MYEGLEREFHMDLTHFEHVSDMNRLIFSTK